MSTIRSESKALSTLFGDLDKLRNRYIESNSDNTISCSFPGFELGPIEKNQFRLFLNCSKVQFKTDWIMRPDYVSYDNYGTVIYWPIILYVNRCFSIEDFNGFSSILVPSSQSISEVISDRVDLYDYTLKLYEVNNKINNVTRYYKVFPMGKSDVSRIVAKQNLETVTNTITSTTVTEPELREYTEEFTLTTLDIANSYVDLTYEPSNISSISLTIHPYLTSQAYGYDYILKYDSNNYLNIRISWNSTDCTLGDGMNNILSVGDTIIVTYIYTQLSSIPTTSTYEEDILDGGIVGG
jgi:hypothetical protein